MRLRGLWKGYREGGRERAVLRGVDAEVGAGEFVALLGPSGSGKSTLLNLAGGLDRPEAGEVVVGGTSLTRMPERERTLFRRRNIGIVFQLYNLIPTLTVEENLVLPLELNGYAGGEARDRARLWLDRVGLADRASTAPDRLSGGEQQRVALARALIHEPLLVLADEPTGNLDGRTGGRVLDLLEGLARESGAAVLTASHSEAVADRADRVLELRDGVLIRRDARVPSDASAEG